MKNCYDVIVVGAGNGGLSAAVTTAMNGLKTLLVERNSVPGGCATSFCRGRFEFEPSLHELANVGHKENPGSVRRLLDSYNAEVDWCVEDTLFRVIADGEDGYDVTLPAGIEPFCDEMERIVPGCRESVAAVFEYVKKINEAIAYISSGKVDPTVLAREHTDFLRMVSCSVDECLDALNMPKKAQNIMKTYWSYLGAPTSELDFAHYALMLERYVSVRPAFPKKRSHEISMALEKAFRDNGGEVRYNSEVTDIIFEDGKAVGVKVGDESIYASRVVLNCFPDTAYSSMINENVIPERAVKLANAREIGMPFFTVYLGLDCSYEELGINDYSVFLFDSPDSNEQFRSCDDPDKSFIIVNCLNKAIPDATPKGSCSLFLTTMLTESAWGETTPEEYKKKKNRIARRMIEKYEKRMGISVIPHIEEIAVASPVTFARYLNTPNGTPYGYRIQSWDTMIARIISGKKESFFEGLYFVGAHGERADGYSSTYSNGNSVGKRIVKEVASK